MKARRCSPVCATWGEGLAPVHSFSSCWHEQSVSGGFGCKLPVRSCETIRLIQQDAKSQEEEMCIVTSVWTRLCSFSSQRPVKNIEVQEINPSNEAGCRSRANRAGSGRCSPSCRPHGSNQLTLEHWHLWERGPTTTAFTTSSLRAHDFLTQLHNINKHVCTQEVKQSNPPGTECWQGMSKRRVGGRWGVLLTTKVGWGPK